MSAPEHPSPRQWHRWLEHELDPEVTRAMASHLSGCEACRAGLLGELPSEATVMTWEAPPTSVGDSARQVPLQESRWRPSPHEPAIDATPADIRGTATATETGSRMIVHSFPQAQLAAMVVPPATEGLSRIEGQVFLEDESDQPIDILILQGDHVLTTTSARNGEPFVLEELLGPGWGIELHLPSGEIYELRIEGR